MKNFRLKLALSAICLAAMAAVGLRALPSGGEGILPYGGDAKSRVDALILGAEEFPEVGPALTDRLTKALEIAPLASEPLFAYALFGGANQEAALKEALRRNPRVLSARLLIAQKLVEEDRYDEAVREVVTLIGVDRDRARDYFAALTEISATEAGQRAILKQLEPARWWTADLALRLNEGSTDFAFLYEVNKLVPQNREAFLRRLVGEGQYSLALLAWLEFSGVAAEDINWPYNERFAERNALPPFNWTVENDRAEFMRGGGLYLVHLARARTLFSRQVMALGPGTYVMNADATGQRASGDGGISLKLRCAGAEDYVASLPLGQMSGAPRPDPVTLTIPPRGCEFQQLEFVGEIGQFPRVSRVEVKSVSIEPIGNSEGEG